MSDSTGSLATRMPEVSVIIPVFNSARLVVSALQSVFAQTFQDFEVIVVDDGSEDSKELRVALGQFAHPIRYIRQTNGGPGSARNTGIAQCCGTLVAFLDADDEWRPEKLARQIEYFRRYPETGLLHTGIVDDLYRHRAQAGPPRNAFCDLYHTRFFINTLTVMVPRGVLEEVGGFDVRREIHIEDWDLWLRIGARYPIGYIDEPLALHRPGGLMSRQVERTYVGQVLVIDKNRDLCRQACSRHRAAPDRCDRARHYVLHRDWGHDRLTAGDLRGAREQLRSALSYAPWDLRTVLLYASTFLRRQRNRAGNPNPVAPSERKPQPVGEVSQVRRNDAPSLVHDTLYRRFRRRSISRMHDLDDRLTRVGRWRKRILFDAASPMSFAVFRPVYERLRGDPRVELWHTSYGLVWEPNEIYTPAGVTENVIPASRAAWMKVDAYVNADFWDMTWLHRRTRRIHLFHGVAGKYALDAPVDLAPAIAAFDCLMFANADRLGRYVDAGLVPEADEIKAALVGYPKVDCLVDRSLDQATIRRSLALDGRVPTVIYAPTWSPYSSLNAMGEQIIEGLIAEGLQVIVKLHDRSYDRRQRGSGGVDWARRLGKYNSHPQVRVVYEADASPYLAVADAMVSDHSSIAFEYMLLDRPIVAVDCPELIARAAISSDKVHRLRAASEVVRTAAQVPIAVLDALRQPKRLSAERQRNAAELFYDPGNATDRALALIYRLLELPALIQSPAAVDSDRPLAAAG